MTFSWTYLINVTLLDTATTNGCINNGLITFTDSPAKNSNSLSVLPCIPKTLAPNNQHCVQRMGVDRSLRVCVYLLGYVKPNQVYKKAVGMYSRIASVCVAACVWGIAVCQCQIILAPYLGQDSGSERETFVTNQRKWRAVDLPCIFLSLYL